MERATPGAYTDALPPGKRVNHIVEAVKRQHAKQFTGQERLEKITTQVGKLVSEHNLRQLARMGVAAPIVGTPRAVAAFTAENVSLIRSISSDYFVDVEKTIHQAMAQGQRHESLIAGLQQRYGVTENRAKLIARDQVLKFNGSLNKLRQTKAGVTKFIWRTVEDERVRGAHDAFDGNTYDWNDPPGDGSPEEGTFPGTAINCRCWAQPIIEGEED
jgi:SPP1 gp7 family putative phage head morphogenesis protein